VSKATNQQKHKKNYTDIQVYIPLPQTPSFGTASSSLGHNVSLNSPSFSTIDNTRQNYTEHRLEVRVRIVFKNILYLIT
jgi:hypothetical protein